MLICIFITLIMVLYQQRSTTWQRCMETIIYKRKSTQEWEQSVAAKRNLQYFPSTKSAFSHPLENSCKYPVLFTDDKNIERDVEHFRKVKCVDNHPNLVSMDSEGYIYVHRDFDNERSKTMPEFSCVYRALNGSLFPNTGAYDWSSDEYEVQFRYAFPY